MQIFNKFILTNIEYKIKLLNDIGIDLEKAGNFHNSAGLITNLNYFEKYDCTPLNTILFAQTGVDGVHFSYLEIGLDINPIIITVPCAWGNKPNSYNCVIAETFDEFLGLGYFKGWYSLDGYFYDLEYTLEEYGINQIKHNFTNNNETIFIEKVISNFKISPKYLNTERLEYLQSNYFNRLEFSKDFIEKLSTVN